MKALLVVLVAVAVALTLSDFRAIDAKNMEIRLAIAYERMAQISANIQNGKIVWSVSDARPNSFHMPSSRNMVRGREYSTTATPIIYIAMAYHRTVIPLYNKHAKH
jgi:hypothetical protein